ncbi:hypothetical protein [Wukongibacter sp. M2B1]|uniref:hypothetical protein n=1 Tax=Wukongibacter sp. M2B1 TaxID=3088895 RepID=UPI003D793CBA
MLKTIDTYFDDFINERLLEISQEITNNNMKVQDLRQDCFDLWDRIVDSLPKEDRKLIFKYEEKRNEEEKIYFEIIYRQGLNDGLKVGNISNEIRSRDMARL